MLGTVGSVVVGAVRYSNPQRLEDGLLRLFAAGPPQVPADIRNLLAYGHRILLANPTCACRFQDSHTEPEDSDAVYRRDRLQFDDRSVRTCPGTPQCRETVQVMPGTPKVEIGRAAARDFWRTLR